MYKYNIESHAVDRNGAWMKEANTLSSAEIALLGFLSEKPMHAWQIESAVEHRDTRSWTDLSQSTIYKQLRSLAGEGLVVVDEQVVDGRLRKVYSVTREGTVALRHSILALLAEPEHMKWRVDLATYNVDLVGTKQALAALKRYSDGVREQIDGYRELEKYLQASGCPRHRQALARRPVYLLEAELEWVEEFRRELKKGGSK